MRRLSDEVIAALAHAHDVELTYTSNAIEGNTLTLQETALIVEKGITVGGKSLGEHLEAQDHYAALAYVRDLAREPRPLSSRDVLELHRRIVLRSQPEIAGSLRRLPRRVAGSAAVFPNPAKLPALMDEFGAWLSAAPAGPETAFEAHLWLVTIHPFADGNGRTARLLMNLILLRAGYVPLAVRPADRLSYLAAIETSQTGGSPDGYLTLLADRLVETLSEYVAQCEAATGTISE